MSEREYRVGGRFRLVLFDIWSLRVKVVWLVGD